MLLIMDTNEVFTKIYDGQPFTYPSNRKKGRIYSIRVIEREKRNSGCDLFVGKLMSLLQYGFYLFLFGDIKGCVTVNL